MKVSLCSVFDKSKDGISDYAGHLANELKKYVDLVLVKLDSYIPDKDYYIAKAMEANKADIAHIQFNYPYFNGSLLYHNRFFTFAEYLKVPIVMTVHEIAVENRLLPLNVTGRFKRGFFNRTLLFWNYLSAANHKKMYSRVERVIAHTRGQAELIKRLIKDKAKVLVIPHGIPMISREYKELPSSIGKKILGVEGKRVLTIFGFINSKKGYELAIDSLPELPDNVILLVAGGKMTDNPNDLEYHNDLLKMISDTGLEDRVKITGYLRLEDIPIVMAATDICLAPFTSLSASGALSLCLGYNKPIIASDIDNHQEINSRVSCLELFRHGDSKDFLKKIKWLLSDQTRLTKLIEFSDIYSDEFSYNKIAARTVALYQDVINSRLA